jgi:hypothetical protein
MSDPVRSIGAALSDAPETAALLARVDAARRAADLISPLALSLACGFDPRQGQCELRDGVLLLTVESSAQAAKLRQAVPRFHAALSANGIQVYEIRLRVQAVGMPYPGQGRDEPSSSAMPFPPISAQTAQRLAREAAQMGGALGAALRRLASTLDRHSRRG